mmetsp:Transcript_18915/g.39370  ORF Transcript_18915/g.39370 Transcript_18915/m.39370 type:complete len:549 (-) Transcript_18915:7-1653(-)
MSKAQYEKWDKFALDSNLKVEEDKIEENAKVDDRDGRIAKLEKHNADVEDRILKEDEDASESLISKSKVEEFRKIKRGRNKRGAATTTTKREVEVALSKPQGGRVATSKTVDASVKVDEAAVTGTVSKEPDATSARPPPTAQTPAPATDEYLAKAESVKRRAECLKEARELRETGKELAKSKKFEKALSVFSSGMQSLDEYEDLLEEPTAVVENPEDGAPKQAQKKKSKSHAVCCGQSAEKIKAQKLLLNPGDLKTTKENLGVTLRRDFNLNIGRCHLEMERPAEAAECFKYVLLVDGGNANAWVARAECFRRMGLYALAKLHLTKAVEIDEVDRNAKAVKKMNDQDLILKKTQDILGDVDGGENDPAMLEVNSRKSIREILGKCVEMYKQGNVIFREQFFTTAREKYERAAACATAAEKICNQSNKAFLPDAINEIRVASHLQAAACNLLRKREFHVAEEHCTQALKAGGFNMMALLRRSDARIELGKYNAAINDLLKIEKRLKKGGADKDNGERKNVVLDPLQKRLIRARYIKDQLGQLDLLEMTN